MTNTEMIEWVIRWAIFAFSLFSLSGVIAALTNQENKSKYSYSILLALGMTNFVILSHALGMLFIYYSHH